MENLPATHRVAILKQNEDHSFSFDIANRPLPKLGPLDVLVKLSATGVCGTDFALAAGKLGPCRSILGHEGVGRVVELGSALTPAHVKIGQRVGVAWVRDRCGSCAMCMAEKGETRCLKQFHSGRTVDGTVGEYTVVPQSHLMMLPEDLKDEEVAPIMCGGVTIYKSLKLCGAVPGQWIAISGAGGGVCALGIQYAKSMGYRVLAIDGGPEKISYCTELGAEAVVDFFIEKNVPAAVKRITAEEGVHAFLAVAGSARAYQQSFEMLAPFGTLVCIGIPPPTELVLFHPLLFIDMGFTIIGTSVGTRADIMEALEFVKRGAVIPQIRIGTLEELNQIKDEFATGQVLGKHVLRIGQ